MSYIRTILAFGLFVASSNLHASNLSTCLDGRYPVLCDRSILTQSQLKSVDDAEHRANLKSCLDGRYPVLCRHGDLTTEDAVRVSKAEHAANLKSCLDGRYPVLCRHGDLTTEDAKRVENAEAIHPRTVSPAPRSHVAKGRGRSGYSDCDDGHCGFSVVRFLCLSGCGVFTRIMVAVFL